MCISTIIWYGVVDYVNFCKGSVGTQDAERGGTPLVSFNHVTDPHFVTFSSSLYATIRNPNLIPNQNPNTNPKPNPNHNRNATVITDPQRPLRSANCHRSDPLRTAFCRVPVLCSTRIYITLFTVNGRKIEKNSANSTHNILTIYTIAYTIANRKK